MVLSIPTPNYPIWDFDDQNATYAATTNVSTPTELNTAIAAALANDNPGAPYYADIVWTAGDRTSDITLNFTASLPSSDGVFIRIRPSTQFTKMQGQWIFQNGVSNVKFTDWQVEPESTDLGSGRKQCFRFITNGGGRRMAVGRCRMGGFWRGTGSLQFCEGFGGYAMAGWNIAVSYSEGRNMFQFHEGYAGHFSAQFNLVTGLIDDFTYLAVRNASPHIASAYLVGNVVGWNRDDPATGMGTSAYHCDFLQTGVNTDTSSDEYDAQVYGNILVGDAYQTSPVQAGIIQTSNGTPNRLQTDWRDNVLLGCAGRGVWTIDRRFRFQRNIMGWPPIAGPVPTSVAPWNGGPYQAYLNGNGNVAGGASSTPIIDTFIAARSSAGWSDIPDPDILADNKAALGTATAYDTVFPAMAGQVSFNSGSLMIPQYAGAMTLADVRNWISGLYEPYTTGNGLGWSANGFNDPASWFASGGSGRPQFGNSPQLRITVA